VDQPPYAALVLAGGRAARVVVGPPQPVPEDVVVVREQPPGGGPVAALRAGLPEIASDVVAVLAGDLPFLSPALIAQLRAALVADGVLVVDDGGRDQYLLGVWRTAALRTALRGPGGPDSLRRVLAPLAVDRLRPAVAPGAPPPWLDCDTPADLARARAVAAGNDG
jgi:molybdopterin-guanine dinucleotide biosynthesis protein A